MCVSCLSNKDQKFISLAKEHACKNENYYTTRLAALLVVGKRVVSVGYNQEKTHPFQTRFQRHEDAVFLHAETDAINKAIKELGLERASREEISKAFKKATLYIYRVKSPGLRYSRDDSRSPMVSGLAKPCAGCEQAIRYYGINRVVYSVNCEVKENERNNYKLLGQLSQRVHADEAYF